MTVLTKALCIGLGTALGIALLTAPAEGQINKPSSRNVPSHAKKSRLNVVKSVTAETDENSSIISVFLERSPSWQKPKVRFQKNFVQVELKGITVLEPGKSYPTKSPHFKKIIPYQIKPGLSALRIYLAKPAAAYKKALSCDILGERLLVYLDHSFIAKPAAQAVRKERLSKEVEQVIATTKVRRNIPDPAEQMAAKAAKAPKAAKTAKAAKVVAKVARAKVTRATGAKPNKVATDAVRDATIDSLNYDITTPAQATNKAKAKAKATPIPAQSAVSDPLPWEKDKPKEVSSKEAEGFYAKLQDKMKTVAIVTIVLLLMLGGVHWYRRKMAGAGALAVQTPHGKLAIPSLKPLATYAIGPKQKLTLIGLHNKMILLGVSSDNIQYLYATEDANDPALSEKISESMGGTQTLNGRRAQPLAAGANVPPQGVARQRSAPRPMRQQQPSRAPEPRLEPSLEPEPRIEAPQAELKKAAPRQARKTATRQAASAGARAYEQAKPGARAGARPAQPQQQSRRQGQGAQSAAPQRKGASMADVPAGEQAPRQAIEDVTSLIRKKLKDLPSI